MSDDTAKSEHQRKPGRASAQRSEHTPGRASEAQEHEDNPYQIKVSDALGSLVAGLKARAQAFEEAVERGATMAEGDARIVGSELLAEFDRLKARFDELMGKLEGRT
jgi:hypothetical protein